MRDIDPAIRRRCSEPPRDGEIADLATRQHGIVARSQLRALGLSPSAIDRRVGARRLIVVHPGVYAVGHRALSRAGVQMAAVLACGTGAVRSHQPAGAALGLLRWDGRPHVTALGARRARPGIVVHRTTRLNAADVCHVDGIPTTTWARTVVDLADVLTTDRLVRVLEQAVIVELYDHTQLLSAIARAPGRRGAGRLTEALARGHHLTPQMTRSLMEDRFLALVRAADPPLPSMRTNAHVRGAGEVDAVWSTQRVAVELDSRRFHSHLGQLERDAAKDAALRELGYTVIRLRWADVSARRAALLRRLRSALARGA